MTARGPVKSVLDGLLGTLTSRNSDYEGYWLLGFLVADLDRRTIDLLDANSAGDGGEPWRFAERLAAERFRELVQKHGVPIEHIRLARLEIERLPGTATADINGETWEGFAVGFAARATMNDGRVFERERRVFVAPHSSRESRSLRWDASRSRGL